MTISEPRLARDADSAEPMVALVPASGQKAGNEVCLPSETTHRICAWSRQKIGLPLSRLLVLGFLGGVYIAFGGALATLITSDSSLGSGPTRWLGGIAFSLGLVLVVIGGAELSTGNCLMSLARLRNAVSTGHLWRNWFWSYCANGAGALMLAWAVVQCGSYNEDAIRSAAIRTAEAKLALTPAHAFIRGILANVLVCLAVWLATSTHSAMGKIAGVMLPVSAFVALGFEHSIANLYLIPVGLMIGANGTLVDLAWNVAPVTAGNLVGGAIIVAGLLWAGHGRAAPTS